MCIFLNVCIYYFCAHVLEILVYTLIEWGFFPGSRNSYIIVLLTLDQDSSEHTVGKEQFSVTESSRFYIKEFSCAGLWNSK